MKFNSFVRESFEKSNVCKGMPMPFVLTHIVRIYTILTMKSAFSSSSDAPLLSRERGVSPSRCPTFFSISLRNCALPSNQIKQSLGTATTNCLLASQFISTSEAIVQWRTRITITPSSVAFQCRFCRRRGRLCRFARACHASECVKKHDPRPRNSHSLRKSNCLLAGY